MTNRQEAKKQIKLFFSNSGLHIDCIDFYSDCTVITLKDNTLTTEIIDNIKFISPLNLQLIEIEVIASRDGCGDCYPSILLTYKYRGDY